MIPEILSLETRYHLQKQDQCQYEREYLQQNILQSNSVNKSSAADPLAICILCIMFELNQLKIYHHVLGW